MRRLGMLMALAVLVASLAVDLADPGGAAEATTTVESVVAAGTDDAEQYANGYVLVDSSDLELVDADEAVGQTVGLRFAGLSIPPGAAIRSAWVQFTVDETQADPTSLTVAGQASDTAAPFAKVTNNVSSRPRTSATVAWQPDPWTTVGSAGAVSRTPDLTTVVQEVVGRSGWTAESALALVITGTGHRTAVAEEHATLAPPRLHVEYTPGTPPPPPPPLDPGLVVVDRAVGSGADDAEEFPTGVVTRSSGDLELVDDGGVIQTVGVRFADLGIPRGARIERSWIQFTTDENDSVPTALTIAPHDSDNAPLLGPNRANLSSRNHTAATVAWAPPPWTIVGEAGPAQRTPDLSAVVQEVVDRPYWWNRSALAFVITGSGHRTAVAHDQNPAQAPSLHIEYRVGAPVPHQPEVHRFAAVGDFGNGGGAAGQVANLISGLDVDAVLTTGDNSYGASPIDDNVGRHYQTWIGNYRGAYGTGSERNRFFPTLGNHDYSDGGGLPAHLDYFDLPGAGIPGSGRTTHERYYDVVLGPVHVFAVNSNVEEPDGVTVDAAQARWLREGLAASTTPWQIVVLHHSPFSSGSHGPAPTLQWPFAGWGADAVLSGHDHDYERLEHDGIPYIVTGAGGVSRYPQATPDPRSVVFSNADDGALLIEACAGRLDFSFHTVRTGVIDTRHVGGDSCTPPPPPVTNDVYAANQVRVLGSVTSGSITSMRLSDNSRQVLREVQTSGSNRTSALEYRWTFTVPANLALSFLVEAHRSANKEFDDMAFEWSQNGGPFRPLVTVTKTTDDDRAQVVSLPDGITGPITVRVRDTNRTKGKTSRDTVAIDRLVLQATVPG